MTTPAIIRAACLQAGITNGDTFALAGPRKAGVRAALLSTILGRKVPQREAGVTAIQDELFRVANIPQGTLAARMSLLADWLAVKPEGTFIKAGWGFHVGGDFGRARIDTPVTLAPDEHAEPSSIIGYIDGDPTSALGFMRQRKVRVNVLRSAIGGL